MQKMQRQEGLLTGSCGDFCNFFQDVWP